MRLTRLRAAIGGLRASVKQQWGGFRRTAKLYSKSKTGVFGAAVIFFFIFLAIFAPVVSSSTYPVDHQVSTPFSIPSWATLLPWYSNTPVAHYAVQSEGFASEADAASWTVTGANVTTQVVSGVSPPKSGLPGSLQVNSTVEGNSTDDFSDPYLLHGETFFSVSQSFQFQGLPPPSFEVTSNLEVSMKNLSAVYLNIVIVKPDGTNLSLSSAQYSLLGSQVEILNKSSGQWFSSDVLSSYLPSSGLPAFAGSTLPPQVVFNETGTYEMIYQVRGVPLQGTVSQSVSMNIATVALHLDGGAYGILGTTSLGESVWALFAWGSRISLEVGILSGIGAVGIGALIGVAAGLMGGAFDEVLGRITDFVLVLPFLPLLIILVGIIAVNPILARSVYVWVVVIFVVVSWPLIARIIRSQVLSVKERQYVEASRALGAGPFHILRKHILPNVMGLVYSQVALNVGGFILLEAALDFLGVAPNAGRVDSWGTMLTYSLPYAITDTVQSRVWWWFLPPGIAIALLSVAFVLVGFALDQVFNPRLRAR